MPVHRLIGLCRSSCACSCGSWALRLDRSVTLHSGARANYLLDAWLRHAAQEAAKVCKGIGEGTE